MNPTVQALLPMLVQVAAVVFMAVGTWVAFQVRSRISTSSRLAYVWSALEAVVHDVFVHERAALEEAAKDRKITPEEWAKLKSIAIERGMQSAGDAGRKALEAAFPGAVGPVVSGVVEQLVTLTKTRIAAEEAASQSSPR